MDIEQKLALIQQIHREQAENERYVYDNLRRRNYEREMNSVDSYSFNWGNYYEKDISNLELPKSWFVSFRFRLLVAAVLFLCFLVMDKKEVAYKDVGSWEIVEYIGSNFQMKDWNGN